MPADLLTRGDTYAYTITFVNADATAFNLSGYTVYWTARAAPDPADLTDANAAVKHSIRINIDGSVAAGNVGFALQSTAAAGVVVQQLTHATTDALVAGTLAWEIKLMANDASFVKTVTSGSLSVTDHLTNRITVP